MKKVLVITNMYPSKKWPHYGVFVKNCVEILRDNKYTTDVVYISKRENKIAKFCAYLCFYVQSVFKGLLGKYDTIYAHYASHTALPILIIKYFNKKIPIIMNVHGNDVVPETSKDMKFLRLVKKVLIKSDEILCPSQYYKKILIDDYGLASKKIVVYPSGGINVSKFIDMDRNEVVQKLDLDVQYKYIGYVSRIEEKKGWNLFLDVAARLAATDSTLRFVVVGDGEQEKEYDEKVDNLGLKKKIKKYKLLSQDQLVLIYNALDVFVFPTYRKSESLGLVGLEAMACKTLVVASDKYGPSSYMKNEENGLTFETLNVQNLYQVILKALSMSQSEKRQMTNKARMTAEEYSDKKTSDILLNIFKENTAK